MLKLKNIRKVYNLNGDEQVEALKGITLDFRDNEFVSILGPSGCGKTTLLNIIGGLDKYTDGDLIINNKSTKMFKDKDFDSYRNHQIGFVFQNYNLISHQTILSNVELALTLSGVSKKERRKRATEALINVGLKDQINKKPNQLSGGQMQRVAIARALVNNPNIILADEPTGALDSKTSIQIMDLLKEISKDKLIIMVTHNEELANTYSNRIIKLLDGQILNDSNPFNSEDLNNNFNNRKTNMSFRTALSLSFNNLLTKKGRTILTSIAGSIGIIGIALILSLSSGVNEYINRVEKDALSSYPLQIENTSFDTSELIASIISNNQTVEHDDDKVYSNNIMVDMIKGMSQGMHTNNLKDFKKFLDSSKDMKNLTLDLKYLYNVDLNIYKDSDEIVQVNPSTVFKNMMNRENNNSYSRIDIFSEIIENDKLLKTQYDVLAGSWSKNYNELMLVVDSNNQINDYVLYSLGIKDQKELNEIMQNIAMGKEVTVSDTSYSYDDLLNIKYKLVLPTSMYEKNSDKWDLINNESKLKDLIKNGIPLKITGIIKAKEDSNASITGTVLYRHSLISTIMDSINNSEIVKEQNSNPNINVFTGIEFDSLSSLDDNLKTLSVYNTEEPTGIAIYAKDFDSKEEIIDIIDDYNSKVKDDKDIIKYTDLVGTMIGSISSIVNTISYVLIAFVTISLVVSSIMIGIITYISVIERTKEIGILRAIGASKRDISRVFNAETIIIGFTSGLFGIITTVLLNIPINMIIKSITKIDNISSLPIMGAIVLILISMTLTLIAGLIPSRYASKKDPVVALRTE